MAPRHPTAALRLLLAAALALACAGCDAPPPFVQLSGLVLDARLQEISGVAASRRHPETLWLINDGGSAAELHAVTPRGSHIASLAIAGIDNTDWEDLAAFELDGRSYLLVADTGDNGGLRKTLQLHVVAEPASLVDATVQPAWSIAFRWPDGPRDCEAVTVDPVRGEVLLVSKKREPPELFSLPLRPPAKELLTAQRIGTLAGVPTPDAERAAASPRRARLDGQVTAAAVSPDRNTLAVMTYRYLLLYPRPANGNWADAVAGTPRTSELPWLPQAEALGWSPDGRSLYATGEFIPAPLYRIDP